ncbi:MAG TPA: hypothetical protein VJZ52_01450 [Candidatus Paceibacterota bacterium]|nr:hypothetical protein [Candidatus Paceibacterota bacterium]
MNSFEKNPQEPKRVEDAYAEVQWDDSALERQEDEQALLDIEEAVRLENELLEAVAGDEPTAEQQERVALGGDLIGSETNLEMAEEEGQGGDWKKRATLAKTKKVGLIGTSALALFFSLGLGGEAQAGAKEWLKDADKWVKKGARVGREITRAERARDQRKTQNERREKRFDIEQQIRWLQACITGEYQLDEYGKVKLDHEGNPILGVEKAHRISLRIADEGMRKIRAERNELRINRELSPKKEDEFRLREEKDRQFRQEAFANYRNQIADIRALQRDLRNGLSISLEELREAAAKREAQRRELEDFLRQIGSIGR